MVDASGEARTVTERMRLAMLLQAAELRLVSKEADAARVASTGPVAPNGSHGGANGGANGSGPGASPCSACVALVPNGMTLGSPAQAAPPIPALPAPLGGRPACAGPTLPAMPSAMPAKPARSGGSRARQAGGTHTAPNEHGLRAAPQADEAHVETYHCPDEDEDTDDDDEEMEDGLLSSHLSASSKPFHRAALAVDGVRADATLTAFTAHDQAAVRAMAERVVGKAEAPTGGSSSRLDLD